MRKKCNALALWSFALAAVDFVITYFCFHFLTDSGFVLIWQPTPEKPFITELLGILGVLFFFSGVMSLLVGRIFFKNS